MAFYTILFSPCGGTRRIAEILEREWKEEQRICIDLCDPQVTESLPYFKEDDTCIIAMPMEEEHHKQHCSDCVSYREIMLLLFWYAAMATVPMRILCWR